MLLTADIKIYEVTTTKDRGSFLKVLGGLFLTMLGVALAFNQGKNGRRRLQRETRRAERLAKLKPEVISEAEAERRRKRASRRSGLFVMLGGALLVGVAFLLNPLATIVFCLLGAAVLIAGFLLVIGFV
ncbi:hypothetical protein [Hymenobacter lucidus]|uniref:Uncharacterized protein n=1 Tax=Hymenobacter lucidus TaxID=2880930 RepID=A0ABS8AMT5_9BACT|nr:hypothetical protein [Hymenobacter lucidus]MCB2407532.1 hypothetical protein [Hymenobacter lucidus]